ncbi:MULTISPECIES: hypothetical protein [Streptomyces]|uniref:Uncharacterized protein n=1 Tax=Streptomyces eurythermus TaxID=42237 RepID=A0ABW6YZX6_9ACTN|nr:hypothetical protein [Streptomyces sp. DSM 40868]QIS75320.1 hypothetical protein HB370_39670 [Streptomyces sp. DSM 40868]
MGRGEGVEIMDVRLGQQVAQGAGAPGGGEQRGQPGGVLVRLALRAQPARSVTVRGGQGIGDRVHGGPAQPGGRGGVVEQGAYGVRAGPLPDSQQGVPLGDLSYSPPQCGHHELRVSRAEQRGEPGARDLAVRRRQLGAQRVVERNGVEPLRDGTAQGLSGTRVAVDGCGDLGVADRDEPGEDPGVEPGMAGQGCPGAGVAVVEDGGDEGGRRRRPAGQQLRRHPLGQGGERGRGMPGLRVFEEEAERAVDTAGCGRTERVVRHRRQWWLGEQFGQGAGVRDQRVVQSAPAGRVPTEVTLRHLSEKGGRLVVGSARGGDLGRHRPRGPRPFHCPQRGTTARARPLGLPTGPDHLAQHPPYRPHLRVRHGRHARRRH